MGNEFLAHLSECPQELLTILTRDEMHDAILTVGAAQDSTDALRPLLRDLLSALSADVYGFLTSDDSGHLLPMAGPFTFVPYLPELGSPTNADQKFLPRTLGIRPIGTPDDFGSVNVITCDSFPARHIETFVADEALESPELKDEAVKTYASTFLTRNYDRASVYFLEILLGGFKVYYADSRGMGGTGLTAWDKDGLELLAMYVYSLYHPPPQHYFRDPTMSWKELPWGRDVLSIRSGGELFPDVAPIFTERPGKRRTTVFLAGRRPTRQAIIKDCYREAPPGASRSRLPSGGFVESAILKHIHARGFVPGVVRLAHDEIVRFGPGEDLSIVGARSLPHVKHRMVLADVGESLLRAESVHDLLKAVYDALEVHRLLANRTQVLHRDMSLNNILMYPRWAKCTNTQVMEDIPPFIDDVLSGQMRPPEQRTPRCLLIDFDLAAMLFDTPDSYEELKQRTGTGVYIARSAAAGEVVFTRHVPLRIPDLEEPAIESYFKAYGADRYQRYNDEDAYEDEPTFHGGITADEVGSDIWLGPRRCKEIVYHHRWEYDVESIFWVLYSVLLRVLPRGYLEEEDSSTRNAMHHYWHLLRSHQFLRGPQESENKPQDTRTPLLDCPFDAFVAPFPPVMYDVAILLFNIAQHVRIPYAAMLAPPPHEDHLHETVQRLILNYLKCYPSDPIWLTPGRLRSRELEGEVLTRVLQGPDVHRYEPESEVSGDAEDSDGSSSAEQPEEVPEEDEQLRVSSLLTGTWSYQYFDPDEYEIK